MAIKINYARVFGYLMRSWAVCFGCLSLLCVGGYWVRPLWMPLLAFCTILLVQAFNIRSAGKGAPFCPLFAVATNYSLIISFLVMVIINLINSRWLIYTNFGGKFANPEIPFISTLVVYPSMVVGYGYAILARGKSNLCQGCRESAGYGLNDTLVRNVFHYEVKYQMRMALVLAIAMSAVTWAYYSFLYINVNINTPDAFYFFAVPALLYIFTVVYFYMKYSSLDFEVKLFNGTEDSKYHTMEHFMVVCDDKLMLQELQVDESPIGLWDTPAVIQRPYTDSVDPRQAEEDFKSISGTADFSLRPLFVTATEKQNCFHYAVFVPSGASLPKLSGKWFTLLEVDRLIKAGKITRPLAYELHRVYTMTMAWKTYDREGKRLYAIRNYRPTFKLADFKDWDIDYTDIHWLAVAQNNEDKPFYKLRRFWRRYITGADRIWRKKSS